MIWLLTQTTAAIIALIQLASSATIDKNTYLDNLPSEDITVNSNAFLALVHANTYTFNGGINNNGYLFMGNVNSGQSGLKTTLSSGSVSNQGTFVLDNRNETNGASLSWSGSSFTNTGTMYFWGAGSPQNSYDFNPSGNFENKGTMVFHQDSKNTDSYANFQGSNVNNDGTICLTNTKSLLKKSIVGNGCITIGENAMMVLQSTSSGTMGSQTLYMTSSSSIIFAESDAKTDNIIVRGFGNGNILTFRTSVDPFRGKWSYDGNSGVLTVKLWPSISHAFHIGKGYDKSKFKQKQITNNVTPTLVNNAVYYDGPVPDTSKPDVCAICPNNPPWIPVINEETNNAAWTGTFLSTKDVHYNFYTDGNQLKESIIYDVVTPIRTELATSYEAWTGTTTNTRTTILETTKGPDGFDTIKETIIIQTPIEKRTTTKFEGWTGSVTNTRSTDFSTFTGSDGSETIEAIYYVQTPIFVSSSDIYISPSHSIDSSSTVQASIVSSAMSLNSTNSDKYDDSLRETTIYSTFYSMSMTIEEKIEYFISTDENGNKVQGIHTEMSGYMVDSQPVYASYNSSKSESVTSLSSTQVLTSSVIDSITSSSIIENFIESASTSTYQSDDWSVTQIVSYYIVTNSNGTLQQGINTVYFRERVDSLPVFLNSSVGLTSGTLTSSIDVPSDPNIISESTGTTIPEKETTLFSSNYNPESHVDKSSSKIFTRYQNSSSSNIQSSERKLPTGEDTQIYSRKTVTETDYSLIASTTTTCPLSNTGSSMQSKIYSSSHIEKQSLADTTSSITSKNKEDIITKTSTKQCSSTSALKSSNVLEDISILPQVQKSSITSTKSKTVVVSRPSQSIDNEARSSKSDSTKISISTKSLTMDNKSNNAQLDVTTSKTSLSSHTVPKLTPSDVYNDSDSKTSSATKIASSFVTPPTNSHIESTLITKTPNRIDSVASSSTQTTKQILQQINITKETSSIVSMSQSVYLQTANSAGSRLTKTATFVKFILGITVLITIL
ncbi:hypothetical protein LTX96_0003560 [Nakaseomyces glabratus]|nr:hypothetical protein LTX96_0003560 [Nakaseomyces glabratus]